MRVLVVEDSAVYRHLIEGLLREWAFDVTSVNDGAKAWDLLQQPDAPRLVLLDWMLPGMDGIELCRRIRGCEPYVYTLLLTAKAEKEHLLEAMEAGADDYLIKPFDAPELKARLLAGKRILKLQEDLVSAREQMRHAITAEQPTLPLPVHVPASPISETTPSLASGVAVPNELSPGSIATPIMVENTWIQAWSMLVMRMS